MATASYLADHEVLGNLRSARRRNRIASLDKFDAFYKAYLVGICGAVGTYLASGWFGDAPISPETLEQIRNDGPGYIGLLVAVVVFIGIRSGGRGGPLAFEQADVRHVLLSPIDRKVSVRRPGFARLRHVGFIGAAIGAAAGIVALRRLPDTPVLWIIYGALFGAACLAFGLGAALIFGGRRIARPIADAVALLAVLWAGADAIWHVETSPFSWLGHVALWPLGFSFLGVLGLVVVLGVVSAGVLLCHGISVEDAERRSRLVGQLRFAATLQDVRTVLVLQRQLAQESIRQRPWIRIWASRGKHLTTSTFMRRSFVSMLRWPLFRYMRVALLVAISAACCAGIWAGEGVLVVPAGLTLWVAALDLLEPLAQESDHQDRIRSYPKSSGWIQGRHLIVPFIVLAVLQVCAAVPAFLYGNSDLIAALFIIGVMTVVLAIGGAALAVTRQPEFATGTIQMPEVAGLKLVWNAVVPPGIAVMGFVPLAVAQRSWSIHHSVEQVTQDINLVTSAVFAIGLWSIMWIRYGPEMRERFVTMGVKAAAGPDAAKRVPKA